MASGFVDLHCHWVVSVDDGVKSLAESRALLVGLAAAGFTKVVATPHMRPGMFENTKDELSRAFASTKDALLAEGSLVLPELSLSSEHFFDDVVFGRLMRGEGLPYPGERAVLVELPPRAFPQRLSARFSDLRRTKKLRPVLAHPERYEPVWDDRTVLDPLLDVGAVMLLDVAALVGKYGRAVRKCAELLVEDGYYYAACSDAHSPRDVDEVVRAIERLRELVGPEEADAMLREGPLAILEGRVET